MPSSARSRCPTVLPVPGACSNRGASPLLCASPPPGLWGPGTATHQNPSQPLRCRHWSYGIRAQPRGSGGGPGGLRGEQKRLLRPGQVFGPSPAGPTSQPQLGPRWCGGVDAACREHPRERQPMDPHPPGCHPEPSYREGQEAKCHLAGQVHRPTPSSHRRNSPGTERLPLPRLLCTEGRAFKNVSTESGRTV